jgi:hypothetical protein
VWFVRRNEDSVYNVLVLNACDDTDRPTAAIANLDVDLENALESLSPGHRSVTLSQITGFDRPFLRYTPDIRSIYFTIPA